MKLYDYTDVAENYDLYSQLLEQEQNAKQGMESFYYDMARQFGQDGVINIACGTGTVLTYLAERGVDVEGTDISEAMCGICMDKAIKRGLNLNVYASDMTSFNPGRKYSLAIISRSGFMQLPSAQQQKLALLNIRELLTDEGILTLNTFDPFPIYQSSEEGDAEDYSFRVEYVNIKGEKEKIYNAMTYNPITQVVNGNWKFVTYNDRNEIIGERIRPLTMRQVFRQEMKWLAELCGFNVLAIYKDYKGNIVGKDSTNCVWVLQKKS